MVEERRALRAFEAHLEEVIGVDEARAVVDRVDRHVTRDYLNRQLGLTRDYLDRQLGRTRDYLDRELELMREHLDQSFEHQADRLAARWRRDLLLVTGAQFFALAGAVAALVALG